MCVLFPPPTPHHHNPKAINQKREKPAIQKSRNRGLRWNEGNAQKGGEERSQDYRKGSQNKLEDIKWLQERFLQEEANGITMHLKCNKEVEVEIEMLNLSFVRNRV